MKFLNKMSKVVGVLALMVVVGSCSMFDLDVNKDPNNPSTTTPSLLLTNVQTGVFNEFAGIEGNLETYVGMVGTQSSSRWDLQNTAYDGSWINLYRNPIKDIEKLLEATDGVVAFSNYRGIAQVMKAYTYGTMVDLFGDIPFSEASKGDDPKAPITLPKFDKDADVYAGVLKLLDEAIVNLAKTNQATLAGDLVYGNSTARWSRLAKTLKLKFLVTGRKGITGADAQINALIAAGDFIAGTGDDFRFQFSKDPTSIRHPWYTGAYTGGDFDYSYITHQFLMETYLDLDPRARFYFRHQTIERLNFNDVTQKNTAPCTQGGCEWGYIPLTRWADTLRARGYDSLFINGIFGRDRGDATGLPADGSLRTLPGVYPCGGFYNAALAKSGSPAANAAPGGGIFPALTEVNVIYYQIEAILASGGTGDARVLFADAIRKHISRVVSFGVTTDAASVSPTTAAIDAYVAKWLARYDAAPAASKLDIVMKQLWFSSWGNGFEIYNAYRRTGFPSSIQAPINPSPKGATSYINRMTYPISELNLNKNMTDDQRNMKYWINKVFWNK